MGPVTPGDADAGSLADETLRGSHAHAAGPAGDQCNLIRVSGHDIDLAGIRGWWPDAVPGSRRGSPASTPAQPS